MTPVIPLRAIAHNRKPGVLRLFDRPKYRQRNIIEQIPEGIGIHYENLAGSFAAMATLACSLRCMQQYLSYKSQQRQGWRAEFF